MGVDGSKNPIIFVVKRQANPVELLYEKFVSAFCSVVIRHWNQSLFSFTYKGYVLVTVKQPSVLLTKCLARNPHRGIRPNKLQRQFVNPPQ